MSALTNEQLRAIEMAIDHASLAKVLDASGVLFSTHRDSTHRKTEEFYAANRGCELPKLEGAHVWKGTASNYTPWRVPS